MDKGMKEILKSMAINAVVIGRSGKDDKEASDEILELVKKAIEEIVGE